MEYLVASGYYLSSFIALCTRTSFWNIPLLLFKKPILYTIDRKYSFYVDRLMDIWVLKELLLDKQYDFYRTPQKNWVVIDIGLGIGEYAIMLSKGVKTVYGYDPDPNRYGLAKKNISFHKAKNIKAFKKEITDLENVFQEHKIRKCHLLKIDCEGCEYQILLGASQNILKSIERIVVEVHLFSPGMKKKYRLLKRHLTQNGFALVEKKNPVHSYLGFLYAEKK